MRILIVDDDYVSCEKLKVLLSKYGECDIANGYTQAMEMYQKSYEEKKPYKLITMDIEMPDMNGPEVVLKLREWELSQRISTEESARILMISIKSSAEEVLPAFEMGCEWYTSKPVTAESLEKALIKVGILHK